MPPPTPSRTPSPSRGRVPTHQSVTRMRIFSHMEGNWEESGAVSGPWGAPGGFGGSRERARRSPSPAGSGTGSTGGWRSSPGSSSRAGGVGAGWGDFSQVSHPQNKGSLQRPRPVGLCVAQEAEGATGCLGVSPQDPQKTTPSGFLTQQHRGAPGVPPSPRPCHHGVPRPTATSPARGTPLRPLTILPAKLTSTKGSTRFFLLLSKPKTCRTLSMTASSTAGKRRRWEGRGDHVVEVPGTGLRVQLPHPHPWSSTRHGMGKHSLWGKSSALKIFRQK